MWRDLRRSLVVIVIATGALGLALPLGMTAVAQVTMPANAAGVPLHRDGVIVGTANVGQPFSDDGFFHGRPSATTPAYNAMSSTGSNLGPGNPALLEQVKARVASAAAGKPGRPVPVDLVTTSASGLDPHLSPAAARFQAARVARARGLAIDDVERLIDGHIEPRLLGLFGEPRVNVVALNLSLLDATAGRQP